jgi:hypothetical protein
MTKRVKNSPTDRWLEKHPEGLSEADLARWYAEGGEGRAKAEFERYLEEHPPKPDPHGLLFYLYRCDALLNDSVVRLPESTSLSPDERAVLVHHLARPRSRLSPEERKLLIRYMVGDKGPPKLVGIVDIAGKPDPLSLSDKNVVYTFVGTMYRLVPHLELLKTATRDEQSGKARDIRLQNLGRGPEFHAILAELYRPELKPKDLLGPLNARLEALGMPPVPSNGALGKYLRKLRRL